MAKTPEEKAADKAAAAEKKAADKAAKAATIAAASVAKTATAVTVDFKGQERTFSKEVHGDTFAELAAEFAATNGGVILQ